MSCLPGHSADVNALDWYHDTLWDLATGEGKLEVAQLLLEPSTASDSHVDGDCTSLHAGSQNGHLDVVRALLGRGEDVNVQYCKNLLCAPVARRMP